MNKYALVTFGLLISLAAGTAGVANVFGKTGLTPDRTAAETSGITVEQARRIALQRVAGTIEDEYTLDDEDENVTAYVFLIKNNQGNRVEIQIDANNGNVLNINEQKGNFDAVNKQPSEAETQITDDGATVVEYETPNVIENYPIETYAPQINPNVRYSGSDATAGSGEIPPQFTLEQARLVAILELNGEIQSERAVTEDGRLTYAFMIKSRSSRITEVRVDAVSGKARKIRRQFGEARLND
jgi:uncharacterized membrane protein YkoI